MAQQEMVLLLSNLPQRDFGTKIVQFGGRRTARQATVLTKTFQDEELQFDNSPKGRKHESVLPISSPTIGYVIPGEQDVMIRQPYGRTRNLTSISHNQLPPHPLQ